MENKKLIYVSITFLIIGLLLGYAIGYGAGVNFAINMAVEKGIYFLHMQGYNLTMDIDKINMLLATYNAKVGGNYKLINNTG